MPNEYLSMRDRLKSEAEQAKAGFTSAVPAVAVPAALDAIIADLAALPGQLTSEHLPILIRCDAEMCLYKHSSLLYPTYLRLCSQMEPFDDDRCGSWLDNLSWLLPHGNIRKDSEATLRDRLRSLTYELAEESVRFQQKVTERSQKLARLLRTGAALAALLIVLVAWLGSPIGKPGDYLHWLPVACEAGALASLVATLVALDLKRNGNTPAESALLLQWRMAGRAALAAAYALIGYSLLFWAAGGLTNPAIGDSAGAIFFLLGFLCGLLDKFFRRIVAFSFDRN